jgi:hypothetical protein
MVGGRSPKMAEETLEILSEDVIKVYLMYYEQLKVLFTQYYYENFNAKKKVRGWRFIEENNTVMHVSAFLKLARCKSLINDLLNVETLHDFIEQIIPPITQKENDYLNKNKRLLTIYNEDKSPMETVLLPEDGEPGL